MGMPALLLYVGVCVASLAAVAVINRRGTVARRRVAEGLCLACGYDLRHATHACPECGRPTPRRLDRAKLRRPPRHVRRFGGLLLGQPGTAVHETPDQTEARLLKLHLNAHGIDVALTTGPLPGQPMLVLFTVIVADADAGRAVDIVRSLE
jgi:predicted RNA-binding Zn-ribbon protein involved in translation (DUF1610 family)